MRYLLLNWLFSAASLLLVAYFVPGFEVSGFLAALLAAIVVGLVNSTLGAILRVVTFPLILITLGVFWLVINALMLELASWLSPGFEVHGFGSAFLGAVLLALVNLLFKHLVDD
jgi:putative membrane protein